MSTSTDTAGATRVPSTPRHLTEVVLPGLVEPSGLLVREGDLPVPGDGQVLVRMQATGVSFAEQQMRRGRYYRQPPFPFVPGYDLVGVVEAVGPGVDPALSGRRVAAVLATGAWATDVVVAASDLIHVPEELDPAEAETLIVNGITAWQMLHRVARVAAGGTIVVLGANGGVGSTLVQLARNAGIAVIGTAAARHHDFVRSLGATPVDHRAPDPAARIRRIAPDGVDAVFDHVGGAGIRDSWRLLRRGGTLVSYGTAATKDVAGASQLPILILFARLLLWNALPNGRRARFYNFWAGRRNRAAFQGRLQEDSGHVLDLLAAGTLTAHIAGRIPLADAARAMELAESHTVGGKVILVP